MTQLFMALVISSTFALEPSAPKPSLPSNYLPVPIIRQATAYSCGPAAVLTVLSYWGLHEDQAETDLYDPLDTTEKEGTHPKKMTEFLKDYRDLDVRMKEHTTIADLREALVNGVTAILDVQAWREDKKTPWKDRWEDGHNIILVAMDTHYAYFSDPSTPSGYAYIPLDELMERWHDYENEDGKRRPYMNLAIFVRGKKPVKSYPTDIIRLE